MNGCERSRGRLAPCQCVIWTYFKTWTQDPYTFQMSTGTHLARLTDCYHHNRSSTLAESSWWAMTCKNGGTFNLRTVAQDNKRLQPETSQAPGLGRSIQLDTSIVKWQGNGWERRRKERISLALAVRNRNIETATLKTKTIQSVELQYVDVGMDKTRESVPLLFPLIPEISPTELYLRHIS